MKIYDALYSWCRTLHAECHGWDPKATIPQRQG